MTSPTRATSQRIVITPPRRWSLPDLREIWASREVLFRFGARDVTLRYRQTGLGVAWVILQPLLSAGVFAIVFGGIANLPSDGIPYFVLSFAGMLAWNVFTNVLTRSAPALVNNAALVSKVFFPRILVPLSSIYSVLIDFVVAFAFFVILLFAFQINPGWPILLLPVWLVLVTLMAAGIGLMCSALMVKYRDVAYVLPVLTQILLYATPIAYTLSAVPEKYRLFFEVNPLTWIMQEFRWSLLGQAPPEPWQVLGSFVVAVLSVLIGALVFEHMERGFADVI